MNAWGIERLIDATVRIKRVLFCTDSSSHACHAFQKAGVLNMKSGSKGAIVNQPTTEYKCKPPYNKSFKTEVELREHEKSCKGGSGQKKT